MILTFAFNEKAADQFEQLLHCLFIQCLPVAKIRIRPLYKEGPAMIEALDVTLVLRAGYVFSHIQVCSPGIIGVKAIISSVKLSFTSTFRDGGYSQLPGFQQLDDTVHVIDAASPNSAASGLKRGP